MKTRGYVFIGRKLNNINDFNKRIIRDAFL